jgi:hypothetical protein
MATKTQTGVLTTTNLQETVHLVLEPVVVAMLETGFYNIMPNVEGQATIAYLRDMEEIIRSNVGCGFNPVGTTQIYNRVINTKPVKAEMSICTKDLNNTIYRNQVSGNNYAFDNPNAPIIQETINSFNITIETDIYKLFWFGNEASTNPFYSQVNGLWGHYIPLLIAANKINVVNANSGTQLQASDGEAILKAMYDSQTDELESLEDNQKVFMVTKELYNQYKDDVRAFGGGDGGRNMLLNGVSVLTYEGIPVIKQSLWQTLIGKTENVSPKHQHRAILTTPMNLVIATDNTNQRNSMEMWIDRTEERSNGRVKFFLGSNYMHHSLMVVAQ